MPDPTPVKREPTKTDRDAKARYLRVLQLSLTTVSATAIWQVLPTPKVPSGWAAFTVPDLVPIPRSDVAGETRRPLWLQATQVFTYVDDERYPGERKVRTADYAYTVSNEDHRELYSWQWHPSVGDWTLPHVHVHRDLDGGTGKLHIPTGRVAFEHVLLFLRRDHGMELARDDADAILEDCLDRFMRYRTW